MENINKDQTQSPKKKKLVIGVAILAVIALIAVLVVKRNFVLEKIGLKKPAATNQQGVNAILNQYKNNLPELKKKAENSTNANDLQNYAVAQYATGDLAGAEKTYRDQIKIDSKNAVVHNNLANALRDQGNFEEAAKEYQEAIKLNPTSATSYINLANMYQYSLNKADEAISVYKDAISQISDSADLYVLLANTYAQKGDKNSAEKYFQKALEIQPDSQAAKAGLERLK